MIFRKCGWSSPVIAFALILSLSLAWQAPWALAADEDTIRLQTEGVEKPVEAVADELIIKYKDDVSSFEKRKFKEANELETERMKRNPLKGENIEKVQLGEAATSQALEAIVEKLEQHEAVEYAEPNYIMSVQSVTPNDTEYAKQWALPKIHAPEAWSATTGNAEVVVAVLDTGLDFSHSDAPVNLKAGYDFVNDDSDPQDDNGHGTFISGVIAAHSNNGQGIAGICWNCSVMPVKVMDAKGMGTYADVAKGIVWAADHGADIINLSIGGYAYSQALQDAVTYAQVKGVLIVAAGGNQGISDPLYPAAYPEVIGVAATDQNDQLWGRSNHGDFIDLSAPGVSVHGLNLNNTIRAQTGTSVSAAHVAGIAGLLLSADSGLTENSLAQKLYDLSVDLGDTGRDPYFGWGRAEVDIHLPELVDELEADDLIPSNDSESGIIPEAHAGGNTAPDPQNNKPREIKRLSDIKISDSSFNDETIIQEFLDRYPGPLKNYKEKIELRFSKDDIQIVEWDAAHMLMDACFNLETEFNCKVLITLLELKTGVITNPDIGGEEAVKLFPTTYGSPDSKTLKDKLDVWGVDIMVSYEEYKKKNLLKGRFRDGGYLSIATDTNINEYVIKIILADMAVNKEEWERWADGENGDFLNTYHKLFGKIESPANSASVSTDAFFLPASLLMGALMLILSLIIIRRRIR